MKPYATILKAKHGTKGTIDVFVRLKVGGTLWLRGIQSDYRPRWWIGKPVYAEGAALHANA